MPRKSLVDSTGHREEIDHLLIECRWGSRTVAKYLDLKYGVRIAASSLRTWRSRRLAALERAGELPAAWREPEGDRTDQRIWGLMTGDDRIPDVLAKRLALVQLQEQRLRIDLKHELNVEKLFVNMTKEVELYNRLLSDVKSDMQDLGIWPVREAVPSVQVQAYGGHATAGAVAATATRTDLSELAPGVTPEALRDAGRTLVLLRQQEDGGGE